MIKLHYTTDLLCGVFQTNLPMLFASGEKSAHSLTIQLREGREPAAIHSQTVKAYFIRSDKSTVFWSGSISGSTVSVTMKESCYVQPGGFSLVIMIGDEDDRTAVFWGVGTVVRSATDSLVDPGGQIPSLEALLALIGTIEAATDAAHEATTAANSAASAANTAAGQANAAASTATTAAGQATSAAGAAHASATTADAAAGNANEAAAVATDAARAIEEMTVEASGLPAGSNPTAAISDVNGHKHVAFGIPAGQTGPKGDTGATPDISIGTVTTGAPGTEASATMTGTAEAPVINLQIPRGDPGDLDNIPWYAGTPSAAGQASPGTSDKVARGDHAHPVPTAEQVGARSNDWLPDGLIYSITALELETMSQEQQAALYGQGYRAIVATYNDTVTMHALAEDGSLAWIGDKPRNLADNPNFSDPINQRGITSGQTITSWDYFIDRWRIRADSGTINFLDNAIETSATIGQPLDPEIFKTGEIVTVAAEWADGTICVGTGTISRSNVYTQFSSETINGHNVYVSDEGNGVDVVLNVSPGAVKRAAIYRGSYTAKTLPPWVAPDPVVELLKCYAYYELLDLVFGQSASNKNLEVYCRYRAKKRVPPTVQITSIETGQTGVIDEFTGSAWVQDSVSVDSAADSFRVWGSTVNSDATCKFKVSSSADL